MKSSLKSMFKKPAQFAHDKDCVFHKSNVGKTINPELFTIDQMVRHGEMLATSHKLQEKKAPYSLLKRLADNEKKLTNNCYYLSAGNKDIITPAAEWLLENFYLIEEHIRLVRQLLPNDFGKSLPVLASQPNYPRIYDIANELIIHSDGHWDLLRLEHFITAYQRTTSLTLGELWALPGMLRLAIIEKLRSASSQITKYHYHSQLAEKWLIRMQHCSQHSPARLVFVLADMEQQNFPRSGAFVAEMMRGLEGGGDTLAFALNWFRQRLLDDGLVAPRLIAEFNQQLATNQLLVSNCFQGLRHLNEIYWPDFIEKISLVDIILQQDASGIYGKMHFDTRDHYRHQIEVLSRVCQYTETEISSKVIALTHAAAEGEIARHVGYYLVDKGRAELEELLEVRVSRWVSFRLKCAQIPLLSWLGSLCLLTVGGVADILFHTHSPEGVWQLWFLALPLTIVVSQFSLNFLCEITTRVRNPLPLPRMDFSEGIPSHCATLVTIPCLISTRQEIDTLLNRLEIFYLGNIQDNLNFALLSDFRDSKTQHNQEDEELIEYATQQLRSLNNRYPAQNESIFILLHRAREFNEQQGVWMGHERKRGKLQTLNAWLRGVKNGFSLVEGGFQSQFGHIKYVITLDSDTTLPRDSVSQMVATMAHPLNRPIYDASRRRVVDGYSILQPRLAEEIPRFGQSRYASLCSDKPGRDPYSCMSSDIYQDLFQEGSFIGKGIYDVDMFTTAMSGICPDNLVLSHDLLEGCYSRSGILSNVVLYEQYPAHYLVDVARRSRWIRGDWQLLNWLRPQVHMADGSRCKNPLSGLSRWKLFDNLRRSLTTSSLLVLLFCALTWIPNPIYWLMILSLMLCLPTFVAFVMDLFNKNPSSSLLLHLRIVLAGTLARLKRIGLRVLTLPYDAGFSLRAISITLWRLIISHRYLNEWISSDSNKVHYSCDYLSFYYVMLLNPVAGLSLIFLTDLYNPALDAIALAIGILWCVTPALMAWLSRAPLTEKSQLNAQQQLFLRQTARETWSYFDTFVNKEENWLAPDNFQETPQAVIAHRTSPTNIGLSLLANMTAWDFGYITQENALRRITHTLDTLDKLEHYRGHLYNWYDTKTLKPLSPRYISSVDSGNLAGHLLTLSSGIHAWRNQPIFDIEQMISGLHDTLSLFEKSMGAHCPVLLKEIRQRCEILKSLPMSGIFIELKNMLSMSVILRQERPDGTSIALPWYENLCEQLTQFCDEWSQLLTWFPFPEAFDHHTLPSLTDIIHWEPPAGHPDILTAAHSQKLYEAKALAARRLAHLDELSKRLTVHSTMDFRFLYSSETHLLSVGYNCDANELDKGKYDLLPSEIRLTNYYTIATNQLPMKSWFALGRLFTKIGKQSALMSWSGSMFEYLMPQLVMPLYPDSLLIKMCESAVDRQIAWGAAHNIPWGVSESGYAAFDSNHNYQYQAFGIPELGLKRGLAENIVIAPYASMLALLIRPTLACKNLRALEKLGAKGEFGFYESLDHTPSRLAHGQLYIIVRSYMAHHQGMSFLALSHLLLNAPMVERFIKNPIFQSARLLLQERMPNAIELYSARRHFDYVDDKLKKTRAPLRSFTHAQSPVPEVQLLANDHYQLMITQAGGGYSRWNKLDLTRWHSDSTRDNYGIFCYLKDVETGEVSSTTWQPTLNESAQYHVTFHDFGTEFKQKVGKLAAHTQIVVSPEEDVELRRLTLTWGGRQPRIIEFTTYAEVVLAPAANDLAHPAFSNLFVQTELLEEQDSILCHRRPREPDELSPWLFHMTLIHGDVDKVTSFETDRAKFIGRGHTPANPIALQQTGPLTNTAGAVLDPIIAIRNRILLTPGVPVTIDIVYGVTAERHHSLALLEKYRDPHISSRTLEIAYSYSQMALRQINATEEEANLFNRLAGSIIYPSREMRAEQRVIYQNRRGQSSLWGYALSGDVPIVLLNLNSSENIGRVSLLVKAHKYWRMKGLIVDLVILSAGMGGYQQDIINQVLSLIATGASTDLLEQKGGIFVRNGEHMTPEDHTLLKSVACVVLEDIPEQVQEQVNKCLKAQPTSSIAMEKVVNLPPNQHSERIVDTDTLAFFNGLGGFSQDGREYHIVLNDGLSTPAPWSNVIANDTFGTLVSESGQSYTWFENAHEYRLTPWSNDPVTDISGEAFYVRDEESGAVWSPTPLPVRGEGNYSTRHGFGYSIFEYRKTGIDSKLVMFVPLNAPVKIVMITLKNRSGRTRKLSVTGYVEWVMSELRSKSHMHITTSHLKVKNGIGVLATNYFNNNGSERMAFFAGSGGQCSFTGDRREFLGRNGSPANPAGMKQEGFSGNTGAGLDPCAVIQSATNVIDGDERTFIFVLGLGKNLQQAESLIEKYLSEDIVLNELNGIDCHWHQMLDKIKVHTPDPAVNLLANGWLLYQTLSCRIMARTGYYQSGGAFGFRDQLQDALSLIHSSPQRLRAQILLCASRQFIEGDVQHWWHPPAGNGVRTRCSDDYLWLPLAICHYIDATDDMGILHEMVNYLEARPLAPGEESFYEQPSVSHICEELWEHGVRAIRHGLRFGKNGLPLMGAGDWNDGMNLVGISGQGESVWLGFFLYYVLQRYASLAQKLGKFDDAALYQKYAQTLKQNLHENAWDGGWYLRGFFDNGEPLGSHLSAECQIDAIAQSWSVLSGAGDVIRQKQSMSALDKYLVDDKNGFIKLLMPPFDSLGPNPGYIRGYLPGVRENGGQYTHGAIWAIMAHAVNGNIDRAWQLWGLINPINHSLNAAGAERYKVEPYVISADVYSVSPHIGRGGWSWYTGSAGWAYRLITESLLGLKRHGNFISIETHLPADWPKVTISYQHGSSVYEITIKRGADGYRTFLDGKYLVNNLIPLCDDGKHHQVEILTASENTNNNVIEDI